MREWQTAVRLDGDIKERINDLLEPMKSPGHKTTVSDALRAAVEEGLTVLEKRYKMPSKRAVTPASAPRPKPVGRRGGKRAEVGT